MILDLRGLLILNDTDLAGEHFGCYKVMKTIRRLLVETPDMPIESILVKTDISNHTDIAKKIRASKHVVINGEGTLHHSSRSGRYLIEACKYALEAGAKLHLVNAVWQDNSMNWANVVAGFESITCRDSFSAELLSKQTGREVGVIPDLSLYEAFETDEKNSRKGKLINCAVSKSKTVSLINEARKSKINFVPITRSLSPKVTKRLKLIQSFERLNPFSNNADLTVRFAENPQEFMQELNQAEFVITGRFHCVCMSLLTQTPFLAFSSNTWKIEALLNDFSLNKSRQIAFKGFDLKNVQYSELEFSKQEKENISTRLLQMRKDTKQLFSNILNDT